MPDIYIPYLLYSIVIFIIIVAVIILIKALIEPYVLQTTIVRLSANNIHDQNDNCPILRIAFFSDLHDKGCKVNSEKLTRELLSNSPDLIIFGGDLCLHNKTPQKGLMILKKIAKEARYQNIPCYAVRGNHDTLLSAQIYTETGFKLLDDEFIIFETKDNARFAVIGFNDSGKNPRIWSNLPTDLPKDIISNRIIAISHNPDIIYKYNSSNFAFMLAGHLHGGQIFMPFKLEHRILRSDLLPREGVVKGIFEKNGVIGYISRGCGCVIVPLRLFSKPEVTHIHIIE